MPPSEVRPGLSAHEGADLTEADLVGPTEECGVFGVWAPGEDVAKLGAYDLYGLQQRAQEAPGMAVSDGSTVRGYRERVLVPRVCDNPRLPPLTGDSAAGHTPYSTRGAGS